MKHNGRIRCIETSGAALIELDSLNQCVRCRRGEGCGAVWVDPHKRGVTLRIEQPGSHVSTTRINLPAMAEGQSVVVEIDDKGSQWLWPVVGAYGLPLLGMLTATGIASALTGDPASVNGIDRTNPWPELVVLFSAAIGLCGGILAWRRLSSGFFRSVLVNAERSLCLQSARIVAINPSSEREI